MMMLMEKKLMHSHLIPNQVHFPYLDGSIYGYVDEDDDDDGDGDDDHR